MADATGAYARVRAIELGAGRALKIVSIGFLVAGLAFGAFAHAMDDVFFMRLASEALIFAGLAISVDLLLGICGLLSLGQALYFGGGAYVSALLLIHVTQNFWLVVASVTALAIPVSVIFGWIAIRSRGVYFALITFGYAQIVSRVIYNTQGLGASDGIFGVPQIDIDFAAASMAVSNPLGFYLFLLLVTMALIYLLWWVLDTPFGRVFQAMRVNEHRLAFIGYNSRGYMLVMYVVAAMVAAMFGALYPMLRGFVSPELLYFEVSGNGLIMVILGGVGTLIGPAIGAMALIGIKSVVGSYTEHHLIVIGVMFVVLVLYFPKGLVGFIGPRLERLLARKRRPKA